MEDRLPFPDSTIRSSPDPATAPHLLPFSSDGVCRAPRTLDQLLSVVSAGDATDVIVFSHGWNSRWQDAAAWYQGFLTGVLEHHRTYGIRAAEEFAPLMVGVFWPSAALLMPWEREPRLAGESAASVGGQLEPSEGLEALAAALPEHDRDRFLDLAQVEHGLDGAEARGLVAVLSPLSAGSGDELGESGPIEPDVILAGWRALSAHPRSGAVADDPGPDDWGLVGEASASLATAGRVALDPRDLIRMATVWQMKDRAGVVGREGVGPLVRELSSASPARLHLVGHSYGAKVMLSALASDTIERPVSSLLLLQPAVNRHCFSASVPRRSRTGGYRGVLARVEQPVLTTYSVHDVPLTRFFHLALRRDSDLGEPLPAPWPAAPSDYAALGGFGPADTDGEWSWGPLAAPGVPYPPAPAAGLCALDGSAAIKDHGDISNPSTWWALHSRLCPEPSST